MTRPEDLPEDDLPEGDLPEILAEDVATAALLRGALHREAATVRPSPDGLERILAAAHSVQRAGDLHDRTGRPRPLVLTVPPPHRPRRRRAGSALGWLPVLAAAAAVALVAGGFGLARLGIAAPGLDAVAGAAPAAGTAPHPLADPLPVYFVERQNERWALVREFTPTTLTDPADRLTAALRLAVTGEGTDPDHTSVWRVTGHPAGTAEQVTAGLDTGTTVIRLPAVLPTPVDTDPRELPPAALAVQQLVWTATATTHHTDPVRILGPVPGTPSDADSGQADSGQAASGQADSGQAAGPAAELDRTVSRDPADPRAPVWVSSLVDSQQLEPGRAVIQGDAVTTERGTVAWRLLRADTSLEMSAGTVPLRREGGGVPAPGERAVWEVILQLPSPGVYQFQVSQPWPGTRAATAADRTATDWVDTKTLVVS